MPDKHTYQAGWGIKGRWLLALLLSVPTVSTLFWWIGITWFESRLSLLEYQQFATLLAVVIAGGYQLYFWVQRNNYHRTTRCLEIPLDQKIPFCPRWIWLYSFLYYLMFGFTLTAIDNLSSGVHLIFGGIILLITGCVICYFFPTDVPASYRQFEVVNLSTRYLAFVQSMDNNRNAFPSMHCAVATYVGLAATELPYAGHAIGYGYIILIAISCLLVKQHVIIDTFAGIVLGAFVYAVNYRLAI
jgi:hypothetical protein